jgi:hypothetical protein
MNKRQARLGHCGWARESAGLGKHRTEVTEGTEADGIARQNFPGTTQA